LKAAAYTNCDSGILPPEKRDAIATVCDEILNGELKDESPRDLANGSGTQSNMNVNEVIANRAQVVKGKEIGVRKHL
jgi:fumarate hydratase class II